MKRCSADHYCLHACSITIHLPVDIITNETEMIVSVKSLTGIFCIEVFEAADMPVCFG